MMIDGMLLLAFVRDVPGLFFLSSIHQLILCESIMPSKREELLEKFLKTLRALPAPALAPALAGGGSGEGWMEKYTKLISPDASAPIEVNITTTLPSEKVLHARLLSMCR